MNARKRRYLSDRAFDIPFMLKATTALVKDMKADIRPI